MKRLLSLTLALCLMLAALSACSTESGSQTTTSIAEEASEAVSAEPAFTPDGSGKWRRVCFRKRL